MSGKEFVGLLPPQSSRPKSNFLTGPAGGKNLIRDQFTISTWLCLGAVAQGLLFLAAGRVALLPALGLVLYRLFIAYAMSVGWLHNTNMDGVLMKKFSAQMPNEEGKYGNKPADNDIVVFLIGSRNSHPLGMLAPGMQEFAGYYPQMAKDLEEHAEEFGYLGMTSWLGLNEHETSNNIMSVCYFRTMEGLHAFAHSPYHRAGWEWWNRTIKAHPHLSIWHETYHVPKGHYESIYVNSHINGINSTTYKYTDEMTGQEMWASPVVDASKGLLKTSAGRMSRSKGDEHDKYGNDPYQT